MSQTFAELLGVHHHSEFLNDFAQNSKEFRYHTIKGYIGYPGYTLNERMRQCIVAIAKKQIGCYSTQVAVKIASLRPDLEKPEPWKVTGVSERIAELVEEYLLSGCEAKKVSEEIAQTSKTTHWRR